VLIIVINVLENSNNQKGLRISKCRLSKLTQNLTIWIQKYTIEINRTDYFCSHSTIIKRMKKYIGLFLLTIVLTTGSLHAQRKMEKLNRGLIAVKVGTGYFLSWRLFGTDTSSTAFNVYKGTTKLNANPITASTTYTDNAATTGIYTVKKVVGGVETETSEEAKVYANNYFTIPLQRPASGTTPDTVAYTYTPNDCSVGDVDGDGEYEIILKWDPSNSKDNSQSGYTGDVYLDAYKFNGTHLWTIDLGKNIRAGAHYTQFMVYDLNSDGKAEVVCKTAPGTIDGTGGFLSKGPAATDNDAADYRNTSGYILTGPEYLTVFNGQTGAEMATVNYNPPRGTVADWGDTYGNRVDRFLACIAYLDGVHPSVVMCRGYYTRMVLVAWDWNGTALTQRWIFDTNNGYSNYMTEGNHNLSVADVDGDGKDEIIYGPAAFDHDGTPMYTTGLKHGDAMHVSDLDPDRPGMEVWDVHEDKVDTMKSSELHDAKTGEIIFGLPANTDVGRGLAADIDATHRGFELWSSSSNGVYSCKGTQISTVTPSVNFRIYWDGDLQDELLDGTKLDKWTGNGTSRLATFYNFDNAKEINGTKANPCLQADLFGDWREELIYYNSVTNADLIVFTSTIATTNRLYTLMHDPQYRESVAWQNVAYNQPPYLSFYIGDGLANVPKPNITLVTAVTAKTQSIALKAGWNLISFNVTPSNLSIDSVFRTVITNVAEIKTFDSFWRNGQNGLFNSLKSITDGAAYLVNMKAAATISLTGDPVNLPFTATLKSGWNLVGLPSQSAVTIATEVNGKPVSSVKNFDGYWQSVGTTSITTFDVGKGYYVKSTAATTLSW